MQEIENHVLEKAEMLHVSNYKFEYYIMYNYRSKRLSSLRPQESRLENEMVRLYFV